MDEERDKVELFGSCSRGIVEMDEVDGEKFVEKGFKHKKIEETQVDIDGDFEGDGYKAVLEMGFAVAVKRLKDVTMGDKEFKEKIESVDADLVEKKRKKYGTHLTFIDVLALTCV
ncbi:hypothetical protein Tco_0943230 [Tanacetum coccineum]